MAYEYKTVLRRENHEFDVFKNRWNSRTSGIIAFDKKAQGFDKIIDVGEINNKTGSVTFTVNATELFKKTTLDILKKILNQ